MRHENTRPENLADHPARKRILEVVRSMPGISISDLGEETGMAWGTVTYHLHMMDHAGIIISVREGRSRRLFDKRVLDAPKGPARQQLGKLALMRRGRIPEVVGAIAENPGVTQTGLLRRVKVRRHVLRSYLDLLTAKELVEEVSAARHRRYFPTEELRTLLAEEPADEEHATDASAVPHEQETDGRRDRREGAG